eukprot:6211866-Pleurochrysis_carterae.AAC.4
MLPSGILAQNRRPLSVRARAVDRIDRTSCGPRLSDRSQALPPLAMLAFLIAAAVHDVAHPGVNNNFLISTHAPLALLYNDQASERGRGQGGGEGGRGVAPQGQERGSTEEAAERRARESINAWEKIRSCKQRRTHMSATREAHECDEGGT